MNKIAKTIFSGFTFLLISGSLFAQEEKPEMADAFMQSGKIYVVITVLAIIFTGIIVYLVRMDRKISKIETDLAEKQK